MFSCLFWVLDDLLKSSSNMFSYLDLVLYDLLNSRSNMLSCIILMLDDFLNSRSNMFSCLGGFENELCKSRKHHNHNPCGDLLGKGKSLVCDVFLCFVTFSYQEWCLIVSIPDLLQIKQTMMKRRKLLMTHIQ